jgi:hypothetical protein
MIIEKQRKLLKKSKQMNTMIGFWRWMEEKNYINEGEFYNGEFGSDIIAENAPKQMLIGYMIEYISNHEYWKKSEEQPFPQYEMEFRMSVWAKDQYKELEKIIGFIDNQK